MSDNNTDTQNTEPTVEDLKAQLAEATQKAETFEQKYHTQYASNANLDKQLKKFEGVDPDRYHMLEAQVASQGKTPPKNNEQSGQMDDTLKEKWSAMEQKLNELTQQNKALQCTDKIMQKAGSHFKEDLLGVIKMDAEREADLVDGKIVYKDERNNIRYTSPDTPLTTDEWIQEKISQYPSAVKSKQFKGNKSENETFSGNVKDITASNYLELVNSGKLDLSKLSMAEQAQLADVAQQALRNRQN